MACKVCDTSFSLVHTQYWKLKECMGIQLRIYVYQCQNGHYFASALELHPASKSRRTETRKLSQKKETLTLEEMRVRAGMKPLDIEKDFITKHWTDSKS